jgi:hypothetical protein
MEKTSRVKKFEVLFCICCSFFLLTSREYAQKESSYDKLVEKYSLQNSVDKNLVKSIIQISSGGDSRAKSQSGAKGLMLLDESVVKGFGVNDPFDPEENIRGGCSYLKLLMNQFNDMEKAIAAFNAGPNEVAKYNKLPPKAETQRFVKDVLKMYEMLKEEFMDSNMYGFWSGQAKYTKYVSSPPLDANIVGQPQPFDLEIIPLGNNVLLKLSNTQLGDPSLYKTIIERNRLNVEYSGPNPYAKPIPNTTAVQNMSYILDLFYGDGILKGEFTAKIVNRVHFNIPELNLPDNNVEIDYTMRLNLKKK